MIAIVFKNLKPSSLTIMEKYIFQWKNMKNLEFKCLLVGAKSIIQNPRTLYVNEVQPRCKNPRTKFFQCCLSSLKLHGSSSAL